jgi:hypothetical protein
MTILVQFPTRARPEKFKEVLLKYIKMAETPSDMVFNISMDSDDLSMNNPSIREWFSELQTKYALTFNYSNNKSKIEAVNANIDKIDSWDIVLLASDDMIPVVCGYDTVIREHMSQFFPDTDGVLWYYDGFRKDLNTLSIMGRSYFNRFGYIYHPSYKSEWCDNEYQDIFTQLNKYKKIDMMIIRHEHPCWMRQKYDALAEKNRKYVALDMKNYQIRKTNNFGLLATHN